MAERIETPDGPRVYLDATTDGQRKRERAARRQMKHVATSAIKTGAKVEYNLYDKRGNLLCHADGTPVVCEASGEAVLVTFRKPRPEGYDADKTGGDATTWYHNHESRHAAAVAYADAIDKARGYAAVAPTSDGARGLALLKADVEDWRDADSDATSDHWLVIGDGKALAWWLRRCRDAGLLERVERQLAGRIGVVATGSGPDKGANAVRAMREARIPKAFKMLRESVAHTTDEKDVAGLCRCVPCGRTLADHDDVACRAPVFVADGAALAEEKQANNSGASAAVRANRFHSTREDVRHQQKKATRQSTDRAAGVPPEKVALISTAAPPCPDWQRMPSQFCQTCKKRHEECSCDK